MTIQKITADLREIPCPFGDQPHGQRVETGVLQINDDWPGVFLRGDNAMCYSMQLAKAAEILKNQIKDDNSLDIFMPLALEELASLLSSSRI
jgi:hypothetical protein